jgi:hypothetical protein
VSVFGDQLSFFPELLENYEVFNMDARTPAGYGKRYNVRKVRGYFSWISGGAMGIEGDLRTENEVATLWVREPFAGTNRGASIRQGSYIEIDGKIFVFKHDDGFRREGAFSRYDLQLAAGVTDRQVTNVKVDLGVSDFK